MVCRIDLYSSKIAATILPRLLRPCTVAKKIDKNKLRKSFRKRLLQLKREAAEPRVTASVLKQIESRLPRG